MEEQALSPEEIQKIEEANMEYMEKKLPYLKMQADYEETVARIDEARLRSKLSILRLAQAMSQPKEPSDENK